MTIEKQKCLRCGYEWYPRQPLLPKTCPKCRSPYWNQMKWKGVKSMSKIRLNNGDTNTSVWRLVTWSEVWGDSPEQVYERFIRHRVIALGWSLVGDLRELQPSSPDLIADRIRGISEYWNLRNAPAGGRSLYSFFRVLSNGDLVILVTKGRRRKVVEVTGSYYYMIDDNLTSKDLYHRRTINIRDEIDPDTLWEQCGGLPPNVAIYDTLLRLR